MKTLVLNKTYTPIGAIDGFRAIVLIYSNKAEALSFYREKVKSSHTEHSVPSVIRVQSISHNFNTKLRFNKRNVFLRDGGKCAYCLADLSFRRATFDHVKPKSKGGPTNWQNIVLSCPECNAKKGDATLEKSGMTLKIHPHIPKPVSALKAFIKQYKSRAPKAWEPWIP